MTSAAIGGGVDLAAQYAKSQILGQPFHYDRAEGATATVLGFATSGLSGLVSAGIVGDTALAIGGRAATNVAIGASANVTQTAILNNFDNQQGSYTIGAVAGGVLGGAGSVLGDFVSGVGSQTGYNALLSEGLSAGRSNQLETIATQSGYEFQLNSPNWVTGGSAFGAGIGSLSGFSDTAGALLGGGGHPSK